MLVHTLQPASSKDSWPEIWKIKYNFYGRFCLFVCLIFWFWLFLFLFFCFVFSLEFGLSKTKQLSLFIVHRDIIMKTPTRWYFLAIWLTTSSYRGCQWFLELSWGSSQLIAGVDILSNSLSTSKIEWDYWPVHRFQIDSVWTPLLSSPLTSFSPPSLPPFLPFFCFLSPSLLLSLSSFPLSFFCG